ncbi:tetratricopeptide repeat protein [Longibacter salinarum]|uniref:tetratricopeptide repeat protein n=1 Tax=Longibacter salinarum TaxID=1850348 RepID=UPI0015CF5E22|nr:tetratricopeptide repeat protein [Longibacter salinarum]
MTAFFPFFTALRPGIQRTVRFSTVTAGLLIALVIAGLGPNAVNAQSSDAENMQRFQLADQFMRAGQYDRAIPILEDLYASASDNAAFYMKLKEAYENVKQYDDAIRLVTKRLENYNTPMLMSEKARLQYLAGREDEAYDTWDTAVSLAPERSSTYRIVYQALTDIRRFDRAIDILSQGRDALNEPNAFSIQIAYLHSLVGNHAEAMQEYIAILEQDAARLDFVRSRLEPFVEQGEGLDASIEALQQAVQDAPLNRAYRELLAWLHIENGDFRAAFDVYRAIDRLEKENGATLFPFAQKAADAGAVAVATDAYEEILERHPDAAVAPAAQLGLGDMYRKQARDADERAVNASGERVEAPLYKAAREAYEMFLETYPGHSDVPSVMLRLARLEQDVFRNDDAAETRLNEVIDRVPGSETAQEARYDLGRLELQRDNLNDARLTFSRIVEQVRTGDLANRARFELAQIDFYRGNFDAAETQLDATNENTSADVANDAIKLGVLIRSNRGPDSTHTPLKLFAEAELLARQRSVPAATARLDSLLETYGRHSLADDARMKRAQLLRDQGHTADAAAAFAELPLIHPRSPYADEALFAAGAAYEELGDVKAAVKAYNRLLENHGGSILAADARSRLRVLFTERDS